MKEIVGGVMVFLALLMLLPPAGWLLLVGLCLLVLP